MAKFSPADAVFSGFRFIKERPATIMVWSAFMLVTLMVASVAMFDIGGDSLAAFNLAVRGTRPNPQQMMKLSQEVLPAILFGALLTTVFGAVLSTAILRVRLKPGQHPWAGLRLGNQELHLLGAKLLVLVMLLLAQMLILLAVVSLEGVGLPPAAGVAVVVVLQGALLVRLSLAGVVSQTEGRISPLRSLRLTGPLFWRLLGAFVLLGAIVLVMLVLVTMIFTALMGMAALAGGGNVDQAAMAMLQGRFADLNPLVLGVNILSSLVQVWVAVAATVVFLCIAADAYKAATTEG